MIKPFVTILLWAALTVPVAAQGTLPCDAPATTSSGIVVHLPLEAGAGLILGRTGSTPFTASFRLHPSIGLFNDALRIGPSGGVFYENPGWLGLLGGRVSGRLWESDLLPGVQVMSLWLSGEGLARLGDGGNAQLGGAVTLDLGELIAISLRGEHDLYRKETSFELSLSSDIVSWFPREESLAPDTTPRTSTLRSLYDVLAVDVRSEYLATFAGNTAMASGVREQLVNNASPLMTAGTIAAMKTALDNAGLHDITVQVDMQIAGAKRETQMQLGGTGVLPNPIDERHLVLSFIEGWCRALQSAQ